MEYVNLGRSGLKVSRLCLGTMTFGNPAWRAYVLPEDESRPIIHRALLLGINFFDTADMYSLGASEEVLGRALRDFASRDDVVVATKVYYPMGEGPNRRGLSRKHASDAPPSFFCLCLRSPLFLLKAGENRPGGYYFAKCGSPPTTGSRFTEAPASFMAFST